MYMGDWENDNFIRHRNKTGMANWEIEAELRRSPSSAEPVRAPVAAPAPVDDEPLPDVRSAQQTLDQLSDQGRAFESTLESLSGELNSTLQRVAEQEKQLKQLKADARARKKDLEQKQQAYAQHQEQVAMAREHLAQLEQKQRQRKQARYHESGYGRSFDKPSYDLPGYGVPSNTVSSNSEPYIAPSYGASQKPAYKEPAYKEQGYGLSVRESGYGRSHSTDLSPTEARLLGRHTETGIKKQPQALPLADDYQPPGWCYQRLEQHEGIPNDYALRALADFKMYWLSTGEARKAWDYRFVKHVIYQWRRDQSEGRTNSPRSTEEKLTDRSWASGPTLDFDD